MFGASFRNQVRNAATRFVGADDGNIAVIFCIALVPILGFVGAAVDYTRANSARSSMQAALDSTALMLSKDLSEGIITTSQVTAKASAPQTPWCVPWFVAPQGITGGDGVVKSP